MVIDKYHKECRKMLMKNNNDMESTDNVQEKMRLQNLNSSLLQRLKKRREEEDLKEVNIIFKRRLVLLVDSFSTTTSLD